jgi:hypothetical protein
MFPAQRPAELQGYIMRTLTRCRTQNAFQYYPRTCNVSEFGETTVTLFISILQPERSGLLLAFFLDDVMSI